MRRPLLVPETIQTSALDCGPAVVASVLAAYGHSVDYDDLRDRCLTSIEGTSIDTLEDVINSFGLSAEQVLLPPDHISLKISHPAILVTVVPPGVLHFVVIWRRIGPLLQIMDPAVGRRYVTAEVLERDAYRHEAKVPSDLWESWARSDEFLESIDERLARLGARACRKAIHDYIAAPGWQASAAVDAVLRSLAVDEGVEARRERASARLVRLLERSPASLLEEFPSNVRPDGDELAVRGALLIRITGIAHARPARTQPLLPTLKGVLSPLERRLGQWAAIGAVAAGFLILAESLLLRFFLEASSLLVTPMQRLFFGAGLLVFLATVLLVDVHATHAFVALGRAVNARLRGEVLTRLRSARDRYFQTRLASDLAERVHASQQLRTIALAGRLLRVAAALVFLAAALIVVAPGQAWAVVLGLALLASPMLFRPLLAERETRVKTHRGALAHFYHDALRGNHVVRAHRAGPAVAEEHEALLVNWANATNQLHKTRSLLDVIQLGTGVVLAAVIVANARALAPGQLLLVAYWCLLLPLLAEEAGILVQELASYKATALRVLEPLRAASERVAEGASTPAPGVHIEFVEAAVSIGGQEVLAPFSLRIRPGEHVALLGPSGAGKSTLLGTLLGWYPPTTGELLINGDRPDYPELRRQTAWIDPTVRLWPGSLEANVRYGSGLNANFDRAVELSGLGQLGNSRDVGENGRFLSGGEAQRVRFARASMRQEAGLVLLDEPFRGLEGETRKRMLENARRHWGKATLIYVCHEAREAATFDRTIIVRNGVVAEAENLAPSVLRPTDGWATIALDNGQLR